MAAMNSTVIRNDTDKLLRQLNDELATSMIPVMVYLCILLIVGVVGNIMVVFYYGYKTRRTSNSVFICMVASFDLLSCCLSIPIEIVDLRYFYMFTNGGLCKVMRFVNHFAAIGSSFTLLMIASDRFRRICKPFERQLSLRQSKLVCGISVMFAALLSSPAFVFYQSVKSDLINADGVHLQGSDCTTTRDDAYRPYFYAFHGTYLLLFTIATIVLFTIYSIIGHVLYKHSKFRKHYTHRDSVPTLPNMAAKLKANKNVDKNADEGEMQKYDKINETKRNDGNLINTHPENLQIENNDTETVNDNKNTGNTNNNQHSSNTDSPDSGTNVINERNNVLSMRVKNSLDITSDDQHGQLDVKTVKYTMVMLVITVVFVTSFLPYLCLVVWKTFQEDFRLYDSSVPFQIGIRSYFLNSALNPVIYGFFNSKFRNFFFVKLCPCCKEKLYMLPQASSSAE